MPMLSYFYSAFLLREEKIKSNNICLEGFEKLKKNIELFELDFKRFFLQFFLIVYTANFIYS